MTHSIVATLQHSALGVGCSESELVALVGRMQRLELAAGQTLLEASASADAAYIVLQGVLEVRAPDGTVLDQDGPGALIGEQALLPGGSGRRNATVVAIEAAQLLRVGADVFRELMAERAERSARVEADADAKTTNRLGRLSGPFRRLLDASERRTFADEEVVFYEGDPADGLHLVLAGRAEVVIEREGEPVHLTTVYSGQCFGGLATLRDIPRTASVVARSGLRTAFVPAERVRALHAEHPELEAFLDSLLRTYALPRRGVLHQRSVFVEGRTCIETVFDLGDGRALTALRDPQGSYRLSSTGAEVARTLEIASGTTVSFDAEHRIVALEDAGAYDDIAGLQELALDGTVLPVRQRRALRKAARQAKLQAPDAILCRCMNLDRTTLEGAIAGGAHTLAQLQSATGCGTVCGGCLKLGIPAMLPAEEKVPEAVSTTALQPTQARLPRMPRLIPWLGNFTFSRDPTGFQQRGHTRLGPVFGAHIMGTDFVFIDPTQRASLATDVLSGQLSGLDARAAWGVLVGRVLGDAILDAPVAAFQLERSSDWMASIDAAVAPHVDGGAPIDLVAAASDAVTAALCAAVLPALEDLPSVPKLARLLDLVCGDFSAAGLLLPLTTPAMRRRVAARSQLVAVLGASAARSFVTAHRNATFAVVSAVGALAEQPEAWATGAAEGRALVSASTVPADCSFLRDALREAVDRHGGGAVWRRAAGSLVVDGHTIVEGALVGMVLAAAPADHRPSGAGGHLFDEAFGVRAVLGVAESITVAVLGRVLAAGAAVQSKGPRRWHVPVVPGMQRPEGTVRITLRAVGGDA